MAEEESFKVVDRRGRGEDTAPGEPTGPGREVAEVQGSGAAPRELGTPDLESLFVMFASSALVNLGEAADPETGERHVDLDQARQAIDILLLLRDKTAGNRTESESRLLEQVLYDLQMRFVQATRQSKGI